MWSSSSSSCYLLLLLLFLLSSLIFFVCLFVSPGLGVAGFGLFIAINSIFLMFHSLTTLFSFCLQGGPASGSQYYTSYGSPHYGPPGPGPYPGPHHHSVPPHMHGGMGSPHGGGGPHIPSTAAPGCSSHGPGQPQAEYGESRDTTMSSEDSLMRDTCAGYEKYS